MSLSGSQGAVLTQTAADDNHPYTNQGREPEASWACSILLINQDLHSPEEEQARYG